MPFFSKILSGWNPCNISIALKLHNSQPNPTQNSPPSKALGIKCRNFHFRFRTSDATALLLVQLGLSNWIVVLGGDYNTIMMSPQFQPHRLLLYSDSEAQLPHTRGNSTSGSFSGDSNFDSNMVIILAALLSALVCALGLNSIVRCALRCSHRFVMETPDQTALRLSAPGLNIHALNKIPIVVYCSELNIPATDCPICLGEFVQSEKVRILPIRNHGFHVKCIDTWLLSRSSCPTCRQPLCDKPEVLV